MIFERPRTPSSLFLSLQCGPWAQPEDLASAEVKAELVLSSRQRGLWNWALCGVPTRGRPASCDRLASEGMLLLTFTCRLMHPFPFGVRRAVFDPVPNLSSAARWSPRRTASWRTTIAELLSARGMPRARGNGISQQDEPSRTSVFDEW